MKPYWPVWSCLKSVFFCLRFTAFNLLYLFLSFIWIVDVIIPRSPLPNLSSTFRFPSSFSFFTKPAPFSEVNHLQGVGRCIQLCQWIFWISSAIFIVHANLLGQVCTERWKILGCFIFLSDVTGKQLVKDFGNQSCQCDSLQEHWLHIKADTINKCHCSYRKGVDNFVQCRL